MKTSLPVLALLLTLTLPAAAQEHDDDRMPRRTVSVSGEGRATAQPDQATVRFGIVTRADEPEAAREQNAAAARDAFNAVRALGVEERKIRLETLRLQPVYEYDEQTRRRDVVAYEALRTAVVELDDLEVLPALVARVVQQGANRLEGVEYGLEDRASVRDEALREAVLRAHDKAALMAGALGEDIGRVLRIDEQQFDMPMPRVRMEAMAFSKAADAAEPEPEAYAAGEIEVTTTVQVVFELQ